MVDPSGRHGDFSWDDQPEVLSLTGAFEDISLNSSTQEVVEDIPNDGSIAVATSNLQRWLSVKSVISPASSSAMDQQRHAERAVLGKFVLIGEGLCGEIFDEMGRGVVLKRVRPKYEADIRADAQIHETFFNIWEQANPTILRIPRSGRLIGPAHEWWSEEEHEKLATFTSRPLLLETERILPLPKNIREALIILYSPQSEHEIHRNNVQNRDCLLRIYLGQRSSENSMRDLKLRNFPMSLEKFEQVGVMKEPLVKAMAHGLGLLH
jgi:hypothetical protein